MKLILSVGLLALAISTSLSARPSQNVDSPKGEERIQREVRHEILMLPYYGVFDHVTFKVDGYKVTLLGQVSRPTLKKDIENVVKKIEGVEAVDNQIEVLPTSTFDEQLRLAIYRSIYGYASLERYAMPVNRPIRIIVKNGNVTLEGIVDSEADKNLVYMRANSVPNVFSVMNNLKVVEN